LALVLEDDAIISKNIKQIYKKLNNKLEKNDYVLLSYSIFDKDELKKY
jgi:GR25 family glycosyltransferase involved in LPS biosynthesis